LIKVTVSVVVDVAVIVQITFPGDAVVLAAAVTPPVNVAF
jgi:hypothetical protein